MFDPLPSPRRSIVDAPAPARWLALSAFYAADLRRARSHDLELGSLWRTSDAEPPWRAGWLESTGELYVVCYQRAGEADPGPVEVLGVLPDRFTVEVGLRGWWHMCGQAGSLAWLRRHAAALGAPSADGTS